MDKKRVRSYFLLLVVAAIWGIAGPVIKYTLPDFPPMIFLTYRFFISVLLMLPIFFVLKPAIPKNKRDLVMITIAGLLGSSVNLGLLFVGFDKSSVLDVTLIGNITPLMVVIAGAIFLKEKITSKEKYGILVAFIGTMVVVIDPLISDGVFSTQKFTGNLIVILANLAWVFYVIITKNELKHRINTMFLTTYMFVLGFVSLLPIAIYQAEGVRNLLLLVSTAPLKSHLGVWYMAVLSGSLAYFLYQEGQKNIEASEATLFGYLGPLFAAPLAVFWLGEKLTTPFILGTVVVAVGVFIAEYRKKSM